MGELIYRKDLEHLREYEPLLEEILAEEIPRHVGRVGIFEQVEFSPEKHPEQRLDVIGIRSRPTSAATLRVLGNHAFGNTFEKFLDTIQGTEQTLEDIAYNLSFEGEGFLFLTTHQRTDDIAAAFGAFLTCLQEFMSRDAAYRETPLNADVFIGKLITGMGAFGVYIPTLLENLGSVRLTLPPSRSMQKLPHEVRVDYNAAVKDEIRQDDANLRDACEGVVRAVAGNGSTYLRTPRYFGKKGKQARVHAGPLADGTIDFMKTHRILPVAIDIEGKSPTMHIHAIRDRITKADDAHDIMRMLAETMSHITGTKHAYYDNRDDFREATTVTIKRHTVPLLSRKED